MLCTLSFQGSLLFNLISETCIQLSLFPLSLLFSKVEDLPNLVDLLLSTSGEDFR